jgi:hypothetical protein
LQTLEEGKMKNGKSHVREEAAEPWGRYQAPENATTLILQEINALVEKRD